MSDEYEGRTPEENGRTQETEARQIEARPRPVTRLTKLPLVLVLCGLAFLLTVFAWMATSRARRPAAPEPGGEPALTSSAEALRREAERRRPPERAEPVPVVPPAPPVEEEQERPKSVLVAEFTNPPPGYGRLSRQPGDQPPGAPIPFGAAPPGAYAQQQFAGEEEGSGTSPSALARQPGYPGYSEGFGYEERYRDELYAAEQAGRFLDQSSQQREHVRPLTRQPALSPYEIKAGTLLPAILHTEINSDLPGALRAWVAEDVHDSVRGQHLIVPRGSILLGTYNNRVVWGERRILVSFDRLLFPDGSSITLPGELGADGLGASGFQDKVNNHYGRIFGSAALISVISAGATVATREDRDQPSLELGVEDELRLALGRDLSRAATSLFRRNLNIAPTLEARPGFRFNVFLTQDLAFPEGYRPMPPLSSGAGMLQ